MVDKDGDAGFCRTLCVEAQDDKERCDDGKEATASHTAEIPTFLDTCSRPCTLFLAKTAMGRALTLYTSGLLAAVCSCGSFDSVLLLQFFVVLFSSDVVIESLAEFFL